MQTAFSYSHACAGWYGRKPVVDSPRYPPAERSSKGPIRIGRFVISSKNLPSADKHYWIATYYALLMPPKKRLKLAAYFTPPQLAKYAIEKLRELGIHPGTSRILDPSSGGAAFLVPLAQVIALDARKKQLDPRATLDKISAITTRMIADPLKN